MENENIKITVTTKRIYSGVMRSFTARVSFKGKRKQLATRELDTPTDQRRALAYDLLNICGAAGNYRLTSIDRSEWQEVFVASPVGHR